MREITSSIRKHYSEFFRIGLALAAAATILTLLFLPKVAFGVTLSHARADSHAADYNLGATVKTTAELALTNGEQVAVSALSYSVAGPQAVPAIGITPAISGTQTLTSSLPKNGSTPLGTLTATAAATDISKVYISYGYGYGYKGLSNVAKITYTINYTPPINLFPVPDPLPGPFNNATKAFNLPGAGGGGGGTQDFTKKCDITGVPIPGAFGTFANEPLDIAAYDEYGDSLWVLLNGPGNNTDVIVEMGITGSGQGSECNKYADFAAGGSNVHSIAYDTNNDVIWTFGEHGGQHFVRICNHSSWPVDCSDSGASKKAQITGAQPGAQLKAATYDWINNKAYVAEYNPNFNGMIKVHTLKIDGGSGNIISEAAMQFPAGPTGGGFLGLEKNLWDNPFPFFGTQNTSLGQFDPNTKQHMGNTPMQKVGGQGMPEIKGYAIMRDKNDVNNKNAATSIVATMDGIYTSSGIPGAGAVVSNTARSITAHGSNANAFVLISPNDIHYVKTTGGSAGTSMGTFKTPVNSTQVEAITYATVGSDNFVYAITNDNPKRKLWKAQINSGGGASMVSMSSWSQVKEYGFNMPAIGGMDASTTGIYLGAQNESKFWLVDFSGNIQGSNGMYNPMGPSPMGMEALTFIPAAKNPNGGDLLVVGRGFEWFRVSPANGQIQNFDMGQPGKPPYNLIGMTTKASGHVMAVDKDTGEAFNAIIPGTPASEATTIGAYTASLDATVTNTTDPSAETASFNLVKASTLGLKLTEVNSVDVSAVANPTVGVTSGSVTIKGLVTDPTVSSVAVTADLSGSILVGLPDGTAASGFSATNDKAQYTPNQSAATQSNYWHITSAISGVGFVSSSNPVAYFGQDDASSPNFCKPSCNMPDFAQQPSQGSFKSPSFTVGDETVLTFKTWYDTEAAMEFDRKAVKFVEDGNNNTTVLGQIIDPYSIFFPGFNPNQAAVGSFKDVGMSPPGAMTSKFWMLPTAYQSSGSPALVELSSTLPTSLKGKTGKIVFAFDSQDPFGNNGTGWIVDDVKVVGSGSKTLAPGTVAADLSWEIPLSNVADGTNTINITAARTAYDATTQSVQLTLIKDITAPVVDTVIAKTVVGNDKTAIANNTTKIPSVEISGTCTEEVPKQLNVYLNGKSIKKITSFGSPVVCAYTANGTLSTANSGVNSIAVVLMDQAGLCNTTPATDCTAAKSDDKMTLNLDVVAPSITMVNTSYPTGYNSARAGFDDMAVCQLNATDTNGIASVKGQSVGSQTYNMNFTSSVPSAVKNQWGATATYLLPMVPPAGVFPGTMTIPVQVTDRAGNQSTDNCTVTITAGLGGFVHNLMPGQNMLSLPIIPSAANTTTLEAPISTMVANVLGADSNQAISSILYYDATNVAASAANRWSIWTASTADTDSLSVFRTGKGYLFQMRSDAFGSSAPLASGLPPSPSPIKFQYEGTFLLTGQSIPPSYTVEGTGGAWNLIGFHAEDKMDVKVYLGALEAPQRIWASVLEYQNYIKFPICPSGCGNTEVVLGAYKRLLADTDMLLGRGYWMFALDDGQIVP
ncbi:MAG: hypothetical protein CL785_01575 [Chloroflexi bacterium]|nr:hypothetical protein [Chloroflexota bacterium]|tara:strand:+ start:40301 stop:44929 length:4629 start_codon:yes stop_codon:yes gene_type:complete